MTISLAACGGSDNKESTTAGTKESTTAGTTAATTKADESATEPTTEEAAEKPYEGMTMTVFSDLDLSAGGNEDSWYWAALVHHALDEWCEENGATWEQMNSRDLNVLMAAIASGRSPELYYSYQHWPQLANLGLVESITDYYDELAEKYGNFYLDLMEYKGDYYGVNLPWNEVTMIMYDRTVFEELGVKTPKEYFLEGNWTFETWANVAQEVTKDLDGDGVNDYVGASTGQVASAMCPPLVQQDDGTLTSLADGERWYDMAQILYNGVSVHKSMVAKNYVNPKQYDEGYVVMGISPVDIWEAGTTMSMLYTDNQGHVIETVPTPMWKEDDPDYFSKVNFFQFAIPKGTVSLDASVSLMDYILEAGCAMEMQPSGLTNYEFTGLRGTTEESKAYIEYRKEKYDTTMAEMKAIPEYDAEYQQAVLDWIDQYPRLTDQTYTDVTYNVTMQGESVFYSSPAATAIPTFSEAVKAQCEKYNATYIFN